MRLEISYREIWQLSIPIMLGSAAQNVITLSDAVLLYRLSEVDFAAIGFVGVFYIAIAATGYSFSRGGQIMIARRMGEGRPEAVGHTFHTMLLFELALAVLMWLFMQYGSASVFRFFLKSPEVYNRCLEYIHYRAFGIFFSYAGVALIALYTGIARTTIILIDTVVLAVVNLVLNYGLIFGKFGLPAMGIGGSGLASSIAEGVAFVVFITFMLFDRSNRVLRIFTTPTFDWPLTRQQLRLSLPVVAHSVVGQGTWVLFFSMIESLSERALAISNLARTVYLFLSIPLWGFSVGVNTLISNLIGQQRHHDVMRGAWQTAKLCLGITLTIAVPTLLFPEQILSPLFGYTNMDLLQESIPVLRFLLIILTLASAGSVFVNALAGTGATWLGLQLQAITVLIYLAYVYIIIHSTSLGLLWAWAAEILYWVIMLALVILYLKSKRWHNMDF